MGIVVQKFGGTSVGSGERMQNVAGIIQRTLEKQPVIAVVSAMSGTTKSEGTTSLLIAAADAARKGAPFAKELEMIEQNHFKAVGDSVKDAKLRDEARHFVTDELGRLKSFLEAISVIRELSPRSQDNVLAVGEKLSARILTAVLNDRGVKAVYTDLAQIIPESETTVNPAFFLRLQGQLGERCRPRDGEVPVVTGFFGMVPGGLLNAVGRGYTDFTTAMIAAGLGRSQADELQVWKEVDGIFTADPRKVPSARVLSSISPAEAAELTYFGSEVLHPFTMERVVSANVPIRIKNSFHPDAPGTVIAPYTTEKTELVTAVTVKRGITVLTITSNRMYNAHGFLARVFNALEQHGIVVDLISTSEVTISCTVERLPDADKARATLEQFGNVEVTPGRAILAIVGEGMKFASGTAGKMFTTLGTAGVNIEMISQGASEINISCVVREDQSATGLNAVHDAFLHHG
ncbi:aspartate kinase [Hyalangium versicolor]|uniref:aspartate kinase n=1 Tax=Hyalangium versicolor TaxID=2861190 RepID=UPI001CD02FBC|nr:aspartate kinase [Hyalangium versicolor]